MPRARQCELLHRDALVERVLGVEQQGQRALAVEPDLDPGDVAHLDLVGDRGDRPVLGFEDAEADRSVVGQDRARPAARPERADRGQREHLRVRAAGSARGADRL